MARRCSCRCFASVPTSSNGGRLLDIEQWRAGVILPVLPPFLPVFHRCRVGLHNAHTATLAEGMKHYWCRCSCHRWKVCPNTVPDGTVAYAVPPETGSGMWDCWIVYPKLFLRDGRLRCPTGTASGFYMGSEIQATFSLRTFHDAHTAGLGQQVADYAV